MTHPYETAKIEVEHLIRKHKLLRLSDLELEALIDALMFERDCRSSRTYAEEASMHEAFEQFTTQQYKELKQCPQ